MVRAQAERALGDTIAAKASLARALHLEPENVSALVENADLSVAA